MDVRRWQHLQQPQRRSWSTTSVSCGGGSAKIGISTSNSSGSSSNGARSGGTILTTDADEAAPANNTANAAATGGGYYSAASIERRVRMPRRPRPEGVATGRTTPPPTEEDFWHAAGAPGYADLSVAGGSATAALVPPTVSPSVPPTPTSSPSSPPTTSTPAASPAAPLERPATYPYVQMAVVRVRARVLPLVMHAYRTALAPAYARLPGFLSAQLLAIELPADASPAAIDAAAFSSGGAGGAGGGGGVVTLHNITTWTDVAAFEAAQTVAAASPAFTDAMAAVTAHFDAASATLTPARAVAVLACGPSIAVDGVLSTTLFGAPGGPWRLA